MPWPLSKYLLFADIVAWKRECGLDTASRESRGNEPQERLI